MPFWTNTRVARTGACRVLNADKGRTLALSGGSFTVDAGTSSSGFDPDFSVLLVNEDQWNFKIIKLNETACTLWPGQSLFLWVGVPDGAWQHTPRTRWKISGHVTLQVNGSTGSDDNDGLTPATAFRTITKAYKTIRDEFDVNSKRIIIELAEGIYTESLDMSGSLVGTHVLMIQGNMFDPSKVVWRAGAPGHCIFVTAYACAIVYGVTLEAPDGTSLIARETGVLDIAPPLAFGTAGTHILATDGGHLNVTGRYEIAGNAVNHIMARNLGRISLGGSVTPVTFKRPVAIEYFLNVAQGGLVSTNGTAVHYENAKLCTGRKYVIASNGVVSIGETALPGTIEGVTYGGSGHGEEAGRLDVRFETWSTRFDDRLRRSEASAKVSVAQLRNEMCLAIEDATAAIKIAQRTATVAIIVTALAVLLSVLYLVIA